jgi:putative methyltransferase (TIGR04325 family)
MNCIKKTKFFILDLFNFLNKNKLVHFFGVYKNWKIAKKYSKGYDQNKILDNALSAAKLVASGKAAYERDGVVFYKNLYSYELITIVLRAATENNNKCTVIDFGGSLGSVYFQNCSFLKGIKNLKWCVVEQNNFVEVGNKYIADDVIIFFNSIKDILRNFYKPNVIIFSGVLQYLPNPYAILKKAINSRADYIVIDRNPFIVEGKTILSIQKVPKTIVDSSYPVWLFNESELKNIFLKKYKEITAFNAVDGIIGYGQLKAQFKGIVYKKIVNKIKK